mgnify:CR=1 FL=1
MSVSQALNSSAIVAVVGTGAMGAGIAQVAAAAGHVVKLLDNRPEAAAKAVAGIRAQFAKLADKGRMGAEAAAAASERLVPVEQLADLADAALVVEAIVESLEAKQKLYRDLEDIVGAGCIFGTNTSSISVTAIGSALQRPERLAGLHFFNPAPLMALVEVVSGLATDPAVAATLFDTAAAWGKTPVHTRSTPGFIVNRVARSYYGEAMRLLGEGAADVATLDAVMREAGGFKMGPFELTDMIGHDVNFAVSRSVWNAYFNDPRFLPSLIQQELVDAGFYGRKSGRGFYDYREGAERPAPKTCVAQPAPADIVLHGRSAAVEAIASYVLESALDPTLPAAARPARRCAVVRTAAVDTRTTLLLVRYRFHLTLPSRLGERMAVAEDVATLAMASQDGATRWLDPAEVDALMEARPAGNVANATQQVSSALASLPGLAAHLDAHGEALAEKLRASHRRVRSASGATLRGLGVRVETPPDVLGLYVFVPVPKGL